MGNPEKIAAILNQASHLYPDIELSIKCRLGIDSEGTFETFHSFVEFLTSNSPMTTFIVHARRAVLSGLNTKDNRTIPPLTYEYVYRIAKLFPHRQFILNGGITSLADIERCFVDCPQLSGVMIGRWPYEKDPLAVRHFECGESSQERYHRENLDDYIRQYVGKISAEYDLDGTSKTLVSRPICALLRSAKKGDGKDLNRKMSRILHEERDCRTVLNKLMQL